MLVLSRKAGQTLLFGKDIEVTVLRVDGEQVRLGIKAPRSVTILRKELLEEVKSEMTQAKTSQNKQSAAAADLRQLAARLKKPKAKEKVEPSGKTQS